MSEQSSVNARGAVDLSALAGQSTPAENSNSARRGSPGTSPAGDPATHGANSWCLSIQPQQLQQLVQLSAQVPVLVLIHGTDETSEKFRSTLGDAVDEQRGRIVLAEIDAAASPEIAQQAGQLPVVTAFLAGQPIGEFDSSASTDQLPQVVQQILQLATQNGITGTVPPQARRGSGSEEPAEPELPPLHKQAHEALEQGDYDTAIVAFEQAIKENPGDEDATIGLAQVRLMKRTQGADLAAARQEAADEPDAVQAQIRVADIDVLGGHVEDAFTRLIRYIQSHAGDEKEKARQHLIELYKIVGDSDPRVVTSRKVLARSLF